MGFFKARYRSMPGCDTPGCSEQGTYAVLPDRGNFCPDCVKHHRYLPHMKMNHGDQMTEIVVPRSTRFDYVRYDEIAEAKGKATKGYFTTIEAWIQVALPEGRAKSLVMTKLEEAYMWCGKALRDEQVEKRGAELQEGRNNG